METLSSGNRKPEKFELLETSEPLTTWIMRVNAHIYCSISMCDAHHRHPTAQQEKMGT